MEVNNRHLKPKHGGFFSQTTSNQSPVIKNIYMKFESTDSPGSRISPAAELVSEKVWKPGISVYYTNPCNIPQNSKQSFEAFFLVDAMTGSTRKAFARMRRRSDWSEASIHFWQMIVALSPGRQKWSKELKTINLFIFIFLLVEFVYAYLLNPNRIRLKRA